MRRLATCSAIGVILLSLGLAGYGTTWTVDLGGSGDFTSIQAAINAPSVVTGDTVQVLAGTYNENVTVSKGISLVGAAGAVLQGTGSGNGFLIKAAEVGIHGFEITNYAIGIRTYGGPASYGDLMVSDVNIHGNVSNGIAILYDSFDKVTILDSQITNTTGNAGNGIGIANGATIAELVVENSTIATSNGHNVYMNAAHVGKAAFNDCTIADALKWAGIMVTNGTVFDEFSISGGSISHSKQSGLCVSQGVASLLGVLTLDGVDITGNGESGLFFGSGASADSMAVQDCLFQSNAWEDVDLSGGWFGAFTVTGDVLFSGNTFGGGAGYALYIGNQGNFGSLTIVQNTVNRAGYRVYNLLAALADASGNWWSSASGPSSWFVSGNVAYSPWLATAPGDAPWLIIVDDVGPEPASGYIGRALEIASDGDSILVFGGTYIQGPQVALDKDLAISGAGASTTTITPSGSTGSSGDSRGWFLVGPDATLNLSGIAFDGAGQNIYQALRWLGDGSVTDCAFANIAYPGYNGIALVPFGGNVDVTGCTFENIGRVGVLYFGSSVTGSTYSGNTYVGKGNVDALDYGVEVGGGATATIQYSDIRNNTAVASSDGSTSAGILVTDYYGPGTTATILFNTLAYNSAAIAVGYDVSDASDVVARYNSMFGNDWGVASTGPLVDAALNWWGDADGPSGEGTGAGDGVSANVIFSPWLGIDPDGDPATVGVQLVSPMLFIVDDVGHAPALGYLGAAIDASNTLGGTDTIEVRHGAYDASEPITEAVNIVSEIGSAAHTTLDGAISIDAANVLLGRLRQGFTITGPITIGAGVDALTIHINWNDIFGVVTNEGENTLDATFNFWGEDGPDTIGLIAIYPILPESSDTVIGYMDGYDLTALEAVSFSGLLLHGMMPGQALLALDLGATFGFDGDEFDDLVDAYGQAAVDHALAMSNGDYETFVTLLMGYGEGGGGGGSYLGGGGGGTIGATGLPAFAAGEVAQFVLDLVDPITGEITDDAVVSVTVCRTGADGAPELFAFAVMTFDGELGAYVFEYDTTGLEPGVYDVYLGSNDGRSRHFQIEITE